MRLLCISDQVDPMVYSASIKERFKDVELVLSAGDLDLSYKSFIVSSLNKPLVFVFGNHNLKHIHQFRNDYQPVRSLYIQTESFRQGYGLIYAGGKVKKVKGLLIAGLGGSIRYNNGPNQFTELGMFFYSLKILPHLLWNRVTKGRFLDILLTHAPPRGIHDQNDLPHHGFRVFLWFMKIFQPKYLVHGHIHLYDLNSERVTRFKNTLVINAFSYILLDTEDGHVGYTL